MKEQINQKLTFKLGILLCELLERASSADLVNLFDQPEAGYKWLNESLSAVREFSCQAANNKNLCAALDQESFCINRSVLDNSKVKGDIRRNG